MVHICPLVSVLHECLFYCYGNYSIYGFPGPSRLFLKLTCKYFATQFPIQPTREKRKGDIVCLDFSSWAFSSKTVERSRKMQTAYIAISGGCIGRITANNHGQWQLLYIFGTNCCSCTK